MARKNRASNKKWGKRERESERKHTCIHSILINLYIT